MWKRQMLGHGHSTCGDFHSDSDSRMCDSRGPIYEERMKRSDEHNLILWDSIGIPNEVDANEFELCRNFWKISADDAPTVYSKEAIIIIKFFKVGDNFFYRDIASHLDP
jgi:hypothetical protein